MVETIVLVWVETIVPVVTIIITSVLALAAPLLQADWDPQNPDPHDPLGHRRHQGTIIFQEYGKDLFTFPRTPKTYIEVKQTNYFGWLVKVTVWDNSIFLPYTAQYSLWVDYTGEMFEVPLIPHLVFDLYHTGVLFWWEDVKREHWQPVLRFCKKIEVPITPRTDWLRKGDRDWETRCGINGTSNISPV